MKKKIGLLYIALIAFNLGAWLGAFAAFHRYPLLMGTGLLAWSIGLRHAVDVDHIAAIDNVTRKLMQAGKRPITVGLMFSLGHSTIVVLASIGIAVAALAMKNHLDFAKSVGGVIGTSVSMLFLLIIALTNLYVLKSVIAAFRRVRRGLPYAPQDLDMLLARSGLLARIFRPMFAFVTRGWHMYFLGFLFGLGFDTATEIGLLGISAAGASQGMPIWSILVFPALFTVGMTLIDTTDSILMMGAYGWAFVKPVRKLYYNITITSISVIVAFAIGGIEGLGLLADQLRLDGPFWRLIGTLNNNFGLIGCAVVGIFIVTWLCSVAIYRWQRFDELQT
ncbi:MAG: HoxN/HupN/NixA family nickel/cobalt transporter [Bordetella sp.]|uniref:HoxN/HupN/NixA family nickel/cobalt transporter n=1 Tax=Bordetella sp. TaxID=28081 RepID=UPI003F7C0BD3